MFQINDTNLLVSEINLKHLHIGAYNYTDQLCV